MSEGDLITVKRGRDCPAMLAGKVVAVLKIDALASVWVEHRGQVFVLARSQVSKIAQG
jgi:hypothetical protein